ncbi:nicotinate phosphoribosyltransferase [Brevibacterium album]|uniref:nicotinate phosphoribosyltransferase n=1 Tax=Brevibacterium album TaxID=417948 RepID=UPI0003FFC3A0|nr:nicotinate phosphoribosyltransferase [Brevibacterium album]
MSVLTAGPHTSALLTDMYELTMLQASLQSGTAHRRSIFEVFGRRLPAGRRYGVVAGTGRVLELLEDFRFADEQLHFLAKRRVVGSAALDYLREYRFTGTIRGYAEGEVYFPGSPLMTVEGTFADAVVLETMILSVLNHDTAVASAASRMANAAGGRPLAEMGSRRTHEIAAVAAARAAAVAGFSATSNLEAGMAYGIPTLGTSAHSFTLVHDTEREAFEAQVASLGRDTTLLLDTYDVDAALRTAIEVAGTGLGGVRIDSGDLGIQAAEVRAKLDELGAVETTITVTSDLDEYAIAALAAAPVDSYGVGTRVVTGSGHPTANLVYKLVARAGGSGPGADGTEAGGAEADGTVAGGTEGAGEPEWVAVAKTASAKSSRGGRKQALRVLDSGIATEEAIGIPQLPAELADGRELLVDLVRNGEIDDAFTGAEGVRRAQERHAASIAELPRTARRLQDGEPAIPTVFYEG